MSNTKGKTDCQAIIWLDMENSLNPISECDSTKIEVNAEDPTCRPPWFNKANVRNLNRQLTKAYACTKANNHILHQDIVTMEILRHDYGHGVIYAQTSNEAQRHIHGIQDGDGSRVLVFLHFNQFAHPARVAKLYDKLIHEVGIIYPTRDEMIWEQGKIYDLQLLDEIASKAGAWRPKTCYRTGNICDLASQDDTVFKRSHSCAGGHIKFVDRTKHKGSPCRDLAGVMDATMTTKTNTVELDETYGIDYARWIHQEYLPSFIDCEFRVFIATRLKKNSKKGENSREPFVVLMVNSYFLDLEEPSEEANIMKTDTKKVRANKTRTNKPEHSSKRRPRSAKTNAAKSIQRQLQSDEWEEEEEEAGEEDEGSLAFEAVIVTEDSRWKQHPHLRPHHVEAYALSIYHKLLERNNKGLDSLKVGVRLDIGVAPKGEGLFVNEITRWYQADHFSFIIGTGDRVPRAWATSFAEVYPAAKNAVRVQERREDARRKSILSAVGARAFQGPEGTSITSAEKEEEPPQRYKVLGRKKYIQGTKRKAGVLRDISEQHTPNVAPKKPRTDVSTGPLAAHSSDMKGARFLEDQDQHVSKSPTGQTQRSSLGPEAARAMNTIMPTSGRDSRGSSCENTIRRSNRSKAERRKKWRELVMDGPWLGA